MHPTLTRRRLLGAAAAAGGGLAAGAAGARLAGSEPSASPQEAIHFHGTHQAGIATPAQTHLHFVAFDVATETPTELRDLLAHWSRTAADLCAGRRQSPGSALQPPTDTGEAHGLGARRLTVTIGLGPGMFERPGDPLGLARLKPPALSQIRPLPGDALDPARSGGDLCVQACADDSQVAFHAVHALTRAATGVAVPRWAQQGFLGRPEALPRATPRNLQGFKDGTNNIQGDDVGAMGDHVWVSRSDGPAWMVGGTYMVTRRIRMHLGIWDRSTLGEQERVIGRHKDSGAPLGRDRESDPVELGQHSPKESAVAADAHIRLASPQTNDGRRLLRRGYSYTSGIEPGSGELDAGLFFIAFQRDPHSQFSAIQEKLARSDALNKHISHTSSAVFACPPGARHGGYVGERLFESLT